MRLDNNRIARWWIAICAGVWLLNGTAHGTPLAAATSQPIAKPSSKAYCGVRCLYAAALAEGVNFSPADLIQPNYIGSREGSSIEELERAATDHGLHTFAFFNGTIDELRSAEHPVILHVESNPGSGRYDHFILCLGERHAERQGGRRVNVGNLGAELLVLDTIAPAGAPARAISSADLNLIWDGAGIIVSKTPINRPFLASLNGRTISGAMAAMTILCCAKWLPRQRLRPTRLTAISGPAAEALVILTLAFLAPAVSAACTSDAFLAQKAQIRLIEQTNKAYFLPRATFAEAARVLADGKAAFVDARYAADYGEGHIPGAINVPVTASAEAIRLYMANVPRDFPIIVYCQSKSCPYSKSVAVALESQGFTSLKLLEGGWREWSAWKQ